MTLKQYKKVRILIVIVISIVFSQSIMYGNYLIPIVVLIASSLLLMKIRSGIKEIMADERDYATGGKAASLVIQVYSWLATIAMFLLYSFRGMNPFYESVAVTLAFSTCFLMILYGLIFRYYNSFSLTNKKTLYSIVALLIFLAMVVFGLRLFSGEDNWICKDGQWIKHGNPSFDTPKTICK